MAEDNETFFLRRKKIISIISHRETRGKILEENRLTPKTLYDKNVKKVNSGAPTKAWFHWSGNEVSNKTSDLALCTQLPSSPTSPNLFIIEGSESKFII